MSEVQNGLDSVVEIENALLAKWRINSKIQKRLHHAAYGHFKWLADTATFTTVLLSLGVGCLNLVFGLTTGPVNTPAVVSGCLSLLSGSIVGLANTMRWTEKHCLHDEYAARYSEVVRDINTESMLATLDAGGVYANESEFIKHVSSLLDRLEQNAPSIPGAIERRSNQKSMLSNGD